MRLPSTLIVALAATQLGNTDCGQVIRDSGFDLWCGEELCAWKIERGEIKRVPTWNEGDSGVEMIGTDVAIEQLTPVDSGDGTCIEFTLIANIEMKAAVDLNVDVFGDGTIDFAERLPTQSWRPLSYLIHLRAPYAGIRFELAKTGAGRAMLANIGAKTRTAADCSGIAEIDARPGPLGSPCSVDGDCGSGLCDYDTLNSLFAGKVCLGCDVLHACAAGEVCGVARAVSPVRNVPQQCVLEASSLLGEQCIVDDQCANGHCVNTVCSTCDAETSAGCANGELCGPTSNVAMTPWTCSPHGAKRVIGEPCFANDECTSGVCFGTIRKQCDDGRQCSSPSQCPFDSGLQNGPCSTVGIQGGTCQ